MKILQELCSVPTAPFAEGHVVRHVEGFVKARKGRLALSRDRWGNLLISLKTKARGARWVFAAHMDHPGFVAERMVDARTLAAHFRGGTLSEYVKGAKCRFFPYAGGEVAGVVTDIVQQDGGYPEKVLVRVKGAVPPNTPGMFDQGPGRVKGGKFYSRVCDDLAGAAAALTMIDELAKNPRSVKAPVAVLLTRAEEVGFVGALAAVSSPELLKKSDRIVAIETSAQQPYAPQGKGAIIRIGDKTSIFNSSLSYFITSVADQLCKEDSTFAYQRALMPGGTCEATVYDVWGYEAGSICVALGNYHNMDKQKKRIGPEYVDLSDWNNMVKLFLAVARAGHEYEPGHGLLRRRLEKRFAKWVPLLRDEKKSARAVVPTLRTKVGAN